MFLRGSGDEPEQEESACATKHAIETLTVSMR
jgi:hypothetical protein